MTSVLDVLVSVLTGGSVVSALFSTVQSLLKRRRKQHPRIQMELENADGTSTTAVLAGLDDRGTEELIEHIKSEAASDTSADPGSSPRDPA
jgi:hypothetical protein